MARFVCPECGKDFGRDKIGFDEHYDSHFTHDFTIKPYHPLYEPLNKLQKLLGVDMKNRKRTVSLNDLIDAVEDGRIRVRVGWNGEIIFKNVRSKKEYIIGEQFISGTYDGWDDE